MQIKKFFWDYLYFTRVERNGILFLLALSTVVLFLPGIYGYFFPKIPLATAELPDTPVFCADQAAPTHAAGGTFAGVSAEAQLFYFNPNTADARAFQALGLPERTIKGILNYRAKGGQFRQPDDFSKIYALSETDFERLRPWIRLETAPAPDREMAAPAPLNMQPFDPNTADAAALAGLGLPAKTVAGWLNYRAKGGQFRCKNDVKRLYNLAETDFQRLYPWMTLPECSATPNVAQAGFGAGGKAVPVRQQFAVQSVDLNAADLEDLVRLPGVGEGWARRILNWRDKLGGFSTVAQVAETRSLPDSVFQKIKPYLAVHATDFKRISINNATWDELNDHPYIEAKQARWIVAFREQHGKYQNVEALLQIPELRREWLEKVRPYLAV
jgi:competence ComEA-like helix-hairpin-helix protein